MSHDLLRPCPLSRATRYEAVVFLGYPDRRLLALVAFGVTFLRFGELQGDGEQVAAAVLGFLLMGVLSGLVLISLLRRTASRSTSAFVVGGYVLAAPFDYVLGIVGPLSLEAFGAGWPPRSMDYLLVFFLLR